MHDPNDLALDSRLSMLNSLETVLEQLQDGRSEVADEIQALQAIFGEESIQLYDDKGWQPGQTLRLQLQTSLPSYEDVQISLIVSLPSTYPQFPPQLQLSGKYIGDIPIDSDVFGTVTRTYMQEGAFSPGEVAIFEGVERAREAISSYYERRTNELAAKEAENPHSTQDDLELATRLQYEEQETRHVQQALNLVNGAIAAPASLPHGRKIYTSEPIVDRKSIFVGHAFELQQPSEVSQVVAYLLSDRKIAKAHHPTMLAYRCKGSNGVMHQDNDDDGETAAGSRLAHLLQILDIDNVLVVVTRWYGGVHLGSDRFKHINQAARDALQLGGFIKPSGKK